MIKAGVVLQSDVIIKSPLIQPMANAKQSQETAAISPPDETLELPLFSLLVATRANGLKAVEEATARTLEISRFFSHPTQDQIVSWEVSKQICSLGTLRAMIVVEQVLLEDNHKIVLGRFGPAGRVVYRLRLYSGLEVSAEVVADFKIVTDAFKHGMSGLCAALAFNTEFMKEILALLPGPEPEALLGKIAINEVIDKKELDALSSDIVIGVRARSTRL